LNERALLFGETKSLVGIVTEPARGSAAEPLGVVLLNAGVLHRIGPNRMNRTLAQRIAEAGAVAMRFDFSGLGDSPARTTPRPFVESVVAETRQAMDVLASTWGVRRFALCGICSGADNALHVATADERVVAAALIEPYSVPAPGALMQSYRRKLLNPRSWGRLLRGRSELWSILAARLRPPRPTPASAAPTVAESPRAAEPTVVLAPDLVPSREEWVAQVKSALGRETRLLFLYSEDSPAYYHYQTLLKAPLAAETARGLARLERLGGTDHAFTPLAAQEALVATVCRWLEPVKADAAAPAGTRSATA